MAIYYLRTKTIGAKQGSIVKASAYRSGEKSYRDKTEEAINYTRKQGIVAKGIITPENAPSWTRNRTALWNKVEASEKRKDARYGREVVLSLPYELSLEQNVGLLRSYIEQSFTKLGMIADYAIHTPSPNKKASNDNNQKDDRSKQKIDQRNIHAHILLTDRPLDGEEFARKKDRSWNDKKLMEVWRENWAIALNQKLDEAGINHEPLDHRSYERQGSLKEAQSHEGKFITQLRRQGKFNKEKYSEADKIIQLNDYRRELNQTVDALNALQAEENQQTGSNDNEVDSEKNEHRYQDWLDKANQEIQTKDNKTADNQQSNYQEAEQEIELEPPDRRRTSDRIEQPLIISNDRAVAKPKYREEYEAIEKAEKVYQHYKRAENKTPKKVIDHYRFKLGEIASKFDREVVAKNFHNGSSTAMNFERLIRDYLRLKGFNNSEINKVIRRASPAIYKKSQLEAQRYAKKFNNYLQKMKRDKLRKEQEKQTKQQQKKRERKR